MPLLACEEEANQRVNTGQTQQGFFRYCKLVQQISLCSHCDCVTLGNAVSICWFTLLYVVSYFVVCLKTHLPMCGSRQSSFFFCKVFCVTLVDLQKGIQIGMLKHWRGGLLTASEPERMRHLWKPCCCSLRWGMVACLTRLVCPFPV